MALQVFRPAALLHHAKPLAVLRDQSRHAVAIGLKF
jgi:hypothetical protein